MTLDPRVWIVVALIAAAASGGWFVNGWRLSGDIEALKLAHAAEVIKAQKAGADAVLAEQAKYNAREQERDAIDQQRTKELSDANEKLERIRAGVADGSIGLRIAATCTRTAPSVQGTTGPARVDDATAPELTPDARQNYLALRQGITTLTKQLEGLQDIIRSQQK